MNQQRALPSARKIRGREALYLGETAPRHTYNSSAKNPPFAATGDNETAVSAGHNAESGFGGAPHPHLRLQLN